MVKWFTIILFVAGLLMTDLPASAQQIRFEDVSEQAGVYTAGGSHGIAVHDYDLDGWEDIFIAASQGRSVLLRNRGDGTFEDVTVDAGVLVTVDAVAPAWGDVNNDGYADLFVGTRGLNPQNKLFLNTGTGAFENISMTSGLALDTSIGSAAFGDYNRDGLLDLFFATRDTLDILYKNTGNPEELFVADSAPVAGLDFSIAMQAAWQDYDLDGDLDLLAVHDANLNSRFYRQQSGVPLFIESSSFAGLQVSRNSMGVAWGDYNNDGWPDVYVTNIAMGNLFKNNGNGTFTDITTETRTGLNGMSWGVVFADFDNDGDQDLFIGNTYDFDGTRSFLYENRGGAFTNIAGQAGAALATNTYGVATGDFNRDGLPDLVVADEDGKNRLLINRTESVGTWIKLQLVGESVNKMAVGARVQLTFNDSGIGNLMVQRTVSAGDSYCSQSSNILHAGLGLATRVDTLSVFWPDGTEQHFADLDINKFYVLTQSKPVETGTEASVDRESGALIVLHQNHPNPFKNKTTITFDLDVSQHVLLGIYDVLGRQVQEVKNEVLSAGLHIAPVDLGPEPAGLYFVRLKTKQTQQIRAMLLIK